MTPGCISAGAESQEEEKEEEISKLRNRECIYNYISQFKSETKLKEQTKAIHAVCILTNKHPYW